jgi:DNA-binding response OmpR family regulator
MMPNGEFFYEILLIDDDSDFVAAVKTVLESRRNYKVLTASDGVFGLAIARAERPDLIILDVLMPFEDGFDTARKLKNDPDLSKIPIMMLTSFSGRKGETDVSVAQGMELEAEGYVEKPVESEELLQRVDKLVKNRMTSL